MKLKDGKCRVQLTFASINLAYVSCVFIVDIYYIFSKFKFKKFFTTSLIKVYYVVD